MHLTLLKFVLCSIKSRARYVWSMQSQFHATRRDRRVVTTGKNNEKGEYEILDD